VGGKEKSRQSFRCGGFELQRRAESYEAPLAGMAGIMDAMEMLQQTRRRRGRLPCWVACRTWREVVTVFYLISAARDLVEDAGDYVVVVGVGDLGAVEGAGDEGFVGAEVVDEDLAVDLGGVERGAALPQEFGLFGLAFD
jgi:hypothetical protein